MTGEKTVMDSYATASEEESGHMYCLFFGLAMEHHARQGRLSGGTSEWVASFSLVIVTGFENLSYN